DSADDESQDEEDAGDDPGDLLVLVIALKGKAVLVLPGADQSDDQIDEGPQAQAAEGDELEDAGPDLAEVETIGAESAEQPRKQPGGEKRFLPDEGLMLPVCGLGGVPLAGVVHRRWRLLGHYHVHGCRREFQQSMIG